MVSSHEQRKYDFDAAATRTLIDNLLDMSLNLLLQAVRLRR